MITMSSSEKYVGELYHPYFVKMKTSQTIDRENFIARHFMLLIRKLWLLGLISMIIYTFHMTVEKKGLSNFMPAVHFLAYVKFSPWCDLFWHDSLLLYTVVPFLKTPRYFSEAAMMRLEMLGFSYRKTYYHLHNRGRWWEAF